MTGEARNDEMAGARVVVGPSSTVVGGAVVAVGSTTVVGAVS